MRGGKSDCFEVEGKRVTENGCTILQSLLYLVDPTDRPEGGREGPAEQEDRGQSSDTYTLVAVGRVGELLGDRRLPSQEDSHQDRPDDQRLASSEAVDCYRRIVSCVWLPPLYCASRCLPKNWIKIQTTTTDIVKVAQLSMRLLSPIEYQGLTLPSSRDSVNEQGVVTSEAEVLVDGGPEVVAKGSTKTELGQR
jgi:hypothetical protein